MQVGPLGRGPSVALSLGEQIFEQWRNQLRRLDGTVVAHIVQDMQIGLGQQARQILGHADRCRVVSIKPKDFTRSGCLPVNAMQTVPPMEQPTKCTCSVFKWSNTAKTSLAKSSVL